MKTTDTEVEALTTQINALSRLIEKHKARRIDLQLKRTALIEAAHTWTVDDYRVVVVSDDRYYEFDEIECEPPTDDDSEAFKERYKAMHEAYYNERGNGIESYVFELQKRDLETDEFETMDALGANFYLADDGQVAIAADARMFAADSGELPQGVASGALNVIFEGM